MQDKSEETAISLSQKQVAEICATIVAAFVGGICLSQLNLQPVSATGAMLQEVIQLAQGNDNGASSGSIILRNVVFTNPAMQIYINALRFLALVLSVALGTIIGRKSARTESGKNILPFVVAIVITIGAFVTVLFTWKSFVEINVFFSCLISLIFGVGIGIMWGAMPEDSQTTAKSALLKQAALGFVMPICQVLGFFIVSYITASMFIVIQRTAVTIKTSVGGGQNGQMIITPIIVLAVIAVFAIICSYHSTKKYLYTWGSGMPENSPATGDSFKIVVICELVVIIAILVIVFVLDDSRLVPHST